MGFSPPGLPPAEILEQMEEEEERLEAWAKQAGSGAGFALAMLAAHFIQWL